MQSTNSSESTHIFRIILGDTEDVHKIVSRTIWDENQSQQLKLLSVTELIRWKVGQIYHQYSWLFTGLSKNLMQPHLILDEPEQGKLSILNTSTSHFNLMGYVLNRTDEGTPEHMLLMFEGATEHKWNLLGIDGKYIRPPVRLEELMNKIMNQMKRIGCIRLEHI